MGEGEQCRWVSQAHLVLASWNSRGGWKDNAVVMKIRRLCLSTKTYLPRFWDQMLRVSYGPRGALLGRDCPFEPVRTSRLACLLIDQRNCGCLCLSPFPFEPRMLEPR